MHISHRRAIQEPRAHPPYTMDGVTLFNKTKKVLDLIKAENLDLGTLVWAICYGNPYKRGVQILVDARRDLIRGEHFQETLSNIYSPPKTESRGSVAKGGYDALNEFIWRTAGATIDTELNKFSTTTRVDTKVFAADAFRDINLDSLHADVKKHCPLLHNLLRHLGRRKSDSKCILVCIKHVYATL